MRDVAALARVSLKTVSRVVNREPGVSPELASRVLDAVARCGGWHEQTQTYTVTGRFDHEARS